MKAEGRRGSTWEYERDLGKNWVLYLFYFFRGGGAGVNKDESFKKKKI